MRLEWAHAQLLGQSQGLVVGGFSRLDLRGVGVSMNSAKLAERQRLVSTLSILPSQVKRTVCMLPGLVVASCQKTDLAEPRHMIRMCVQRARADIVPERVFQEGEPLGDASRERRRMA